MRILVSGSTGLVGRRFLERARARGDEVMPIVRSANREGVHWDQANGTIGDVSGFDAVLHLAGESVASGRWNAARKERIRASRVDGTTMLAKALASADSKPSVLVSASAIGFYGDRGDEALTEASEAGGGFFPETCTAWENAADAARDSGVRVVHPRIGIVLSRDGGALQRMLLPFKLCVGGVLGNGRQWMSWIALDDLVAVLERAITDAQMEGAYNTVAPEPVTNREFTKALGAALGRPTVLPAPAFALRLLLGREMADNLLLGSTRVVPERLQELGHEFAHSDIESALRAVLS